LNRHFPLDGAEPLITLQIEELSMLMNNEPYATTMKNHFDAMRLAGVSVTTTMLAGTEKLVGLQIDAAQSYLAHTTTATRELMQARDLRDYLSCASTAMQGNLERAISYHRQLTTSVYEVTSELSQAMKAEAVTPKAR
jgi:phasin family protein